MTFLHKLLLLLLLCCAFFGCCAARGEETLPDPVFTISPANPVAYDTVSLIFDQTYDRITAEALGTNETKYHWNTDTVTLWRLEEGVHQYSVRCERGSLKTEPILVTVTVGQRIPERDDGHFEYEITNGTATILRYTGDRQSLIIPDSIGGFPVTKIGDGAFCSVYYDATGTRTQNLTEYLYIQIPETVKIIGTEAFSNNHYLNGIVLPQGLEEIRRGAFLGCQALNAVNLPSSLRVLGSHAFENTGISEIAIPQGITAIPEALFYGAQLTHLTLPPSVEVIEKDAFRHTELETCTFPENLRTIGDNAFSYTKLTEANLPQSLLSIGDEAFSGISGLQAVLLPEGLNEIGNAAFSGCRRLASLTLPAGLRVMRGCPCDAAVTLLSIDPGNPKFRFENGFLIDTEEKALLYCMQTSGTVTVPEGIQRIEDHVLDGSGISGIVFPSTLREIGDAFNRTAVTALEFPDGLESIGRAFCGCDELTAVTIPASVRRIDPEAFTESYAIVFSVLSPDVQDFLRLWNIHRAQYEEWYGGDGDEFSFRIVSDRTEAAMGETVTWTVYPEGLEQQAVVAYFISTAVGVDEYNYNLEYFFPDFQDNCYIEFSGEITVENNEPFQITYQPAQAGVMLLTLDGGYESEAIPVHPQGAPLEVEITPDRSSASGEDFVAWTITPTGGQAPYDIRVNMEYRANEANRFPREEKAFVSSGEAIVYRDQILAGRTGISYDFTVHLIVQVTDANGIIRLASGGTVVYTDPVCELGSLSGYHQAFSVGERVLGTDFVYQLSLEGGVPPYRDIDITMTSSVIVTDPDGNEDDVGTLVKQLHLDSASENLISIPLRLSAADTGTGAVKVEASMTDARGFTWHSSGISDMVLFITLVGPMRIDILSGTSGCAVGDTIRWDISAAREKTGLEEEPYYIRECAGLSQVSRELYIMPCRINADGTETDLLDSPLYTEIHQEPYHYSLPADQPGEYYLKVQAKDQFSNCVMAAKSGGNVHVTPHGNEVSFFLPSRLTAIEAEAFQGIPMASVYIPSSVTSIEPGAIPAGTVIYADAGSYAYDWADGHGYQVIAE